MLEDLYQKEIVEKNIEKENTRMEVAKLLEKMYQEQKAKVLKNKRSTSLNRQECQESDLLIFRSSLIGLSFIQLWVDYHENNLNFEDFQVKICEIMSKAKLWGKLTKTVAETIKKHLLFLLDYSVNC